MITIGAFLSPMTPGHPRRPDHRAATSGRASSTTYGIGFISLDFTYRVPVTRQRLAGRCQCSWRPSEVAAFFACGRAPWSSFHRPRLRLGARWWLPRSTSRPASLSRWARTNHWNCSSCSRLLDHHVLGDLVEVLELVDQLPVAADDPVVDEVERAEVRQRHGAAEA